MSSQGSAVIDFGAFPGSTNTSLAITGQTGIAGTALVDAWLTPKDTADHSLDEHVIEPPNILAGSVVTDTGFTIYASTTDGLVYGLWNVSWVWNN